MMIVLALCIGPYIEVSVNTRVDITFVGEGYPSVYVNGTLYVPNTILMTCYPVDVNADRKISREDVDYFLLLLALDDVGPWVWRAGSYTKAGDLTRDGRCNLADYAVLQRLYPKARQKYR